MANSFWGGWEKHIGKWDSQNVCVLHDKIFRGKVENKFGAVVPNLSGDWVTNL